MWKRANNWVSNPFIFIHFLKTNKKLPLGFHFLCSAEASAKYFARVFAVSKKRAVKFCSFKKARSKIAHSNHGRDKLVGGL